MNELIKILAVDDDDFDRMFLKRMLKQIGQSTQVMEAQSGNQALALLQQEEFHCVFLDYRLPGEDGIEVLKRIHAAGFTLPVVVFTGMADEQTAVELMKAGAVDYLPKDMLTPELLKHALDRAMKILDAHQRAEEAQRALQQSEAYTRAIIENSIDAIITTDSLGNIQSLNTAAEKMFGYTPGELVGQHYQLLVPGGFPANDNLNHNWLTYIGTSDFPGKMLELQGQRKKGELFPIELAISKMDLDGTTSYVGILRDISERQQNDAQRKLIKSVAMQVLEERPLQEILAFVCNGVVEISGMSFCRIGLKTPQGEVVFYADSSHTPESLRKHVVRWDVAGEDHSFCSLALLTGESRICNAEQVTSPYCRQIILNQGIGSVGAFPLVAKNKVLGVLSCHAPSRDFFTARITSQLENLCGQIAIAINAAKDRQQLRILTAALESAANTVIITDRAGNIQWLNPAFTELTGYAKEEALGQNPRLLKSQQHDQAFYQQMWEQILGGQVWQGEVINARKDGGYYTEEMTVTPVRDDQGTIQNFIAIKQDITQRKRAEVAMLEAREQLARAERMASLGTMSAGIAHEINQPLNSLKVIADGMLYWHSRGKGQDLGKVMENVQKISAQASRIDEIIKHMRSFVRQETNISEFRPCNLNHAVEGSLSLLSSQMASHGIRLVKELQEELPYISGQPTRLEEVLINLVVNAIQSLDEVPQGDKEITCATWLEKERVILEVSDNGQGIGEENKHRIFDPFFTTKPVGVGMGLGLSIVHSIVSSMGGQINCIDNESGGATFRAEFPCLNSDNLRGEAYANLIGR